MKIAWIPMAALLVMSVGCHPRSSAPAKPEAQSPGPSPKRAAARAAMKPPTGIEALLLRVRGENRGIDFVRPAPVTFTWSDAQGKERAATGAMIAARFKVEGDYTTLNQRMQAIADSLTRDGFVRDLNNTTEIMDGLIDGATVACVRSVCTEGGGCVLDVRIGRLEKVGAP
jgi:hypothetical protein